MISAFRVDQRGRQVDSKSTNKMSRDGTGSSPRDPFMPEPTATVRPHSPDAAAGSDRKRRRKVLSCYDCRRRKLQCDRAMPACTRCRKAGQAASCIYLDDATDTPTRNPETVGKTIAETNRPQGDTSVNRQGQSAPPPGDLLSRLEYQDRRIKELEAALNLASQGQTPQWKSQKLPLTPDSIIGVESNPTAVNATDRETMLLRGRSFKTQFHGISHPGSLLAYIPDLGTFTKEMFERFPALYRTRQDLKTLEDRTEYAGSKHQTTTDADLKALLPPQTETDELVQLYFDNYDCIYHIVHLPSFYEEYYEMWSDIQNARAHFVAIVLLMTATVQCIRALEPWLYTANSSTVREKALATIRPCEDWLATQSQKHVGIADFQIRFLLNLAKLVNASKFKRTWTDAGTFVRFCMAAGLHRNPESLRKPTSAMDKEMRRRIWFAAADFELQTSFDRGMLSTPWLQQSEFIPPTNIHDNDFDQETKYLPSARPLREYTSSSYLAMASETFLLRYTLNAVLNNVRQTISFEEVKRYTEEIEAHLQPGPLWADTTAEIPHALITVNMRQYMLVLHDRQIRQSTSQSERAFSKMIIVDTARKIMDTQKSLLEKGCRVLHFLCHDQIRAALAVFHAMTVPDPQADSILNDIVNQSATRIVDDGIELITDKIHRLGREQRQLWMILAANAFMKTKRDPDQKFVYMQEAVDKVMSPYYKIIACQQEGAPSTVPSGPPTGRTEMPNGIVEYLPTDGQTKLGELGSDPSILDFDAISAWTFDDWNLNPADFAAFSDPYQPLNPL